MYAETSQNRSKLTLPAKDSCNDKQFWGFEMLKSYLWTERAVEWIILNGLMEGDVKKEKRELAWKNVYDMHKANKKVVCKVHTNVVFACFMGTFHTHNDFYTVQTVYSIPLH